MIKKENLLIAIGVFVITVCFILIFLYKIEPIYSLSLRISDTNFLFNKHKIHKDIAIVLVDEKSINKLGRWPWDRQVLAKGLEKFNLARAVVLDMIFSEKSYEKADYKLADTLSNGNYICGIFVRKLATENVDEDTLDILVDSALSRVSDKVPFPEAKFLEVNILPITESCTLSGIFNAISDKDGIFRRYPLGFVFQGDLYPSLGLQALRIYFNQDITFKEGFLTINNIKIPVENGTSVLNYYQKYEYDRVSYSFLDIFEGKVPKEEFKDKIVIIGISEAGITDIRATPLGQIPGSFLHLTFISNAIDNILLVYDYKKTVILIVLFNLLTTVIYIYLSGYKKYISYAVVMLIPSILAKLFYINLNIVVFDFYVITSMFLNVLYIESLEAYYKSKESKFLKRLFGTYVSPKVLDEIVKNPEKLKLGGEKKEITVLFSDIRSFTTISEHLSPEKLIEMLNIYMSRMSNIILENNGTLDKYIGDAIMAIFNAPIDVKEHKKLAILSGYQMLKTLKDVNEILKKQNFPQINIGIGINSGEAVVGNIGSERKLEYTAIGDTVNLASRLEGLNKVYFGKHSGILISEFTAKDVELPFFLVELDMVVVKGKEKAVSIYTITEEEKVKEKYEMALSFYKKGDFLKALKIFESLKFYPAKTMKSRCEELLKHPPDKWEGIYVAKTK